MKSLYVGPSGRRFTKDQLRAIHAGGSTFGHSHMTVKSNEFAAPAGAVVGAASTAVGVGARLLPAMEILPEAATGVGAALPMTSVVGAVATPVIAAVPKVNPLQPKESTNKAQEEFYKTLTQRLSPPPEPGFWDLEKSKYGEIAGHYLDDVSDETSTIFKPNVLNNTQLVMERYGARFSENKDYDYNIDVDKLRKVLKKQYPNADIDAKIKLLPEDKYMETALKDNPGREKEAIMSNGFYSPTKDTAYLEKGEKLNTVRALIHELVHDMANEGVEDYMLNEGYADYVAYKIMTEELGVPMSVARATIGYPDEMKKVSSLVKEYGREDVDKAFLKDHTLTSLGSKTPLLALNA